MDAVLAKPIGRRTAELQSRHQSVLAAGGSRGFSRYSTASACGYNKIWTLQTNFSTNPHVLKERACIKVNCRVHFRQHGICGRLQPKLLKCQKRCHGSHRGSHRKRTTTIRHDCTISNSRASRIYRE